MTLLYSLHATLHFDNRFLEGLNLWHASKSSGLFILIKLIVMIELSDLRRSKYTCTLFAWLLLGCLFCVSLVRNCALSCIKMNVFF